ncbi:glycine oxidase ThiO [Nonomuraea sp. NPDC055795]
MHVIVGGGVVGLSVAWRLARSGRPVTVVDPAPASGATHAAAGMLAPVSEVTFTEEPLLRLGAASLARWPAFAAELTADAGLAAGALDYRADGTLDVAFGADDLAVLEETAGFMEKLGLRVERLSGRECRRLEPMLAPSVRGGLLAPDDAWVDPRRVASALLAALERLGVPIVRARVRELLRGDEGVQGVRLSPGDTGDGAHREAGGGPYREADGGPYREEHGGPYQKEQGGPFQEELCAERVVLAAGAWSGSFAPVPVRPVKGQILRLRSPRPLLGRCVRGTVHGLPVYLVPRGDGELVVGATQEELGFDTRVTAGGVYELLRDARELVPGVTELELAEVVAGLRPCTPDNLPLIGPGAEPRLLVATGHHRGGVLLAPLTAAVLMGEERELSSLCSPARFTP